MNNNGDLAYQFLAFEKENNLFDLQDTKGTYYWDIIRYYVYIKLLSPEESLPKKHKRRINEFERKLHKGKIGENYRKLTLMR